MKKLTLKHYLLLPLLSLLISFQDVSACTSFDLDYTFTCINAGDMITVTWTSGGCAGGEMVDISLIDIASNSIVQYFPGNANTGSFTFTTNSTLVPGMYRLYIQYAPSWPPDAWDYGSDFEIKASTAPVQWGDFDCRASEENKVELKWSTYSEVNNDGFEIEHSSDGMEWNLVDFVQGNGNSSSLQEYSYEHLHPKNGVNYYRLKQLDFNGSFDYSQTNLINLTWRNDLKVYPTMVESELNLDFGYQARAEVQIYDLEGRLFLTKKLDGLRELYSIDISSFPSKVFLISVESQGQIITKRIIKD